MARLDAQEWAVLGPEKRCYQILAFRVVTAFREDNRSGPIPTCDAGRSKNCFRVGDDVRIPRHNEFATPKGSSGFATLCSLMPIKPGRDYRKVVSLAGRQSEKAISRELTPFDCKLSNARSMDKPAAVERAR
jgi:hypothetical protein